MAFVRFVATAVAPLLAACGGSSDEPDLAQRYGFRAQALAYENRQPKLVGSGEVPCIDLIVAFSLRATARSVGDELKAETVQLSRAGSNTQVWEQAPSPTESGIKLMWVNDTEWLYSLVGDSRTPPPGFDKAERVVYGVARGCRTPSLRLNEPVRVGVRISAGEERATVSVEVPLYAAY